MEYDDFVYIFTYKIIICIFTETELKEFYKTFADEMTKKIPNASINENLQESSNENSDYLYELSAVVTHKGYKSTESGHYVADIFRYFRPFLSTYHS